MKDSSSTTVGQVNGKLGHVRILPIERVKPSPENGKLYGAVDPNDPEVRALADSIAKRGIQEPLVVTQDNYILSGHRRLTAAWVADLREVPVRVYPARRADLGADEYLQLLVTHNRQRIKTFDQKLREEVVLADRESAYQALVDYRKSQSRVTADTFKLRGKKRRAKISPAKLPFLGVVLKIIQTYEDHWPLSVRRIHYLVIHFPEPVLKHASKPDSVYHNDLASYKSLDELTVRARLEGSIPWEAIDDETRPIVTWNVHDDIQSRLRAEVDQAFRFYYRNLMQSQPNHIEIVGEKLTIRSTVHPVASDYTIPYTLGRGYACKPVQYKMAQRFHESGKHRLVILFLTDHDPDGDEIAHSFARDMRDEFGVKRIDPIKAALTPAQVARFDLPTCNLARAKGKGKPKHKRFVRKHGSDHVYELEAVKPDQLQCVLREAIDSVIDTTAFEHEVEREKEDARDLGAVRNLFLSFLAQHGLDDGGLPL